MLLSQDRCVTYNASNLIMVLYSSLKREPKLRTTLWGFEICLKSRVWNSRVTEIKNKETVANIKNFCYSTCWWQVLADKTNSVALRDLTQLQNTSSTTTTKSLNYWVLQLIENLSLMNNYLQKSELKKYYYRKESFFPKNFIIFYSNH